MGYVKLKPPTKGQKITMGLGMKLNVPDNPIVLYIEGDGTGPDLWAASVRENTEDIYAGIEWERGSPEVRKVIDFLQKEMGVKKIRFPESSSIGVKPVSEEGTHRLVRAAINWALAHKRKNVTLVHKGNIMKYTEGYFRKWGYELAKKEFADKTVAWDDCGGNLPAGRLLIKDAIADNFLQQILTRPAEYDVIATLNLNGDYISDALAAQVGGLGIAPGANIN